MMLDRLIDWLATVAVAMELIMKKDVKININAILSIDFTLFVLAL